MEQTISHLAHVAAWIFFIGFVFAVIGIVATTLWIVKAIRGTTSAVESGMENVQRKIKG